VTDHEDGRLRCSVVIPTYNRARQVVACLEALERQTAGFDSFEVIVVDDGSEDGTVDTLRRRQTPLNLRVIRASHGGPSRARNAGVEEARSEILAFTEDDTRVAPDWIERVCHHIDSGADVVDGSTRYVNSSRSVRRFEDETRRPPAFIPCNLVMRRAVFHAVGGYDAAFWDRERGLYFREDTDLGFRILDAGFRVIVAPDVVAFHPEQFVSFGDAVRHTRRYELDPLLYRKHPRRFRQLLEVKYVGGTIPVHRPLHYAALANVILTAGAAESTLVGARSRAALLLAAALGCATVYRARYQGADALRLWRAGDTARSMILPAIYVRAIVTGCIRYRSFGALF
jgi:glycosyltransferase involved in cell wall biosynthesis